MTGSTDRVDAVLVRSPVHDDHRGDLCAACLGLDDHVPRNVLLVRYAPIDERRLSRIAAAAERVAVLAVGCSQPRLDDERIDVTEVPTPGDVTRLGIVVTRILRTWDATAASPVL